MSNNNDKEEEPEVGTNGSTLEEDLEDEMDTQQVEQKKLQLRRELFDEEVEEDEEEEEDEMGDGRRRRVYEEDEEDEGEDLFGDNMMKDYEIDPSEEVYDPELLDDDETVEPLTWEQRNAAEEEMEKRDAKMRGEMLEEKMGGRGYSDFVDDDIEVRDMHEDDDLMRFSDEEDDDLESADEVKGDLQAFLHKDVKESLANTEFRKLYAYTFRSFLEHEDEQTGTKIYINKIDQAARMNKQSITIDFMHMLNFNLILNLYLTDAPEETLSIMNEVLMKKVKDTYPRMENIHKEWYVRFYNMNSNDNIRDLRHVHLNMLISVKGVITRRTAVFPQLKVVKYDCQKCQNVIGPVVVSATGKIPKPGSCPSCDSKGPFTINQTQTVYQNYQKVTLQESPGSIPPGRIPRSKDVILLNDLIDIARPGDEVEITGIYKHSYNAMLNVRQGFPVFSTVIEANAVRKMHDKIELDLFSESEKTYLERLKRNKTLQKKIANSVAPSIFGHEDLKLAIVLSMIGASRRVYEANKHEVRGDINILMVGDPGTAKSQFLKYIEKTARRAVYTTGKGSTAVGLTASVRKDPMTSEWVLEGGALVLADRGTCLIDEFDKMNDQDRTSIHEAMEQQTISISKAGIVTTLQARCAVIAAANPVRGKYDTTRTFRENVDLTDPILSRFDILSVVRDTVDASVDERLARFVVDSHANSHPAAKTRKHIEQHTDAKHILAETTDIHKAVTHWSEDNDLPIPQDFLKKYIAKAKELTMNYNKMDSTRLKNFYVDLRGDSKMGGGIQITLRHLESMLRLAEANARLHLRDSILDEDVTTAIKLMLESYISTQKYAVTKTLRQKYQAYLKSPKDNNRIILHVFNQIVTEFTADDDDIDVNVRVDTQLLRDRVKQYDIHSIEAFLHDRHLLQDQHILYEESENVLIKTF